MGDGAPILEIKGITKQFGKLLAVNNVSLDIVDGEFFTIVGPSGSGKTTLLRMLAGLEKPSGGDVVLRGNVVNDVPANKRPTCMVFQSLALFNHRTVGQNIEFSLKMRGVSRAERKVRAMELMKTVRLPEDYYAKGVTKCSGGERQRVALARALASDPDIMFFDEPLSAIDYQLRKHLEVELKDLHRETGKTFMYITHSLEEAMVMSDRIGIMQAGHLIQVGTPDEIYSRPLNKFVSEFMGEVNTLGVKRSADGKFECAELSAQLAGPAQAGNSDTGYLVIRPESMRFLSDPSEADNHVKGSLFNEYAMGSRVQYHVRAGGYMLVVEKLREQAYQGKIDDDVIIGWDVKDSVLVSD
ncbi:MAG: ABC transporter ATP-binding protein [Rhodospirillaceae bacterium]|nr:ABC transporter ATP-binding protein [Rhodospirillaceae bacterium]MBT5677069.1 ABC transporter ATP-binding protein [Rhodospirillaceae bacterium]MBT7290927.1 ABC transporter ATP-binding protein [Rhodospirillaceae bacterium]